MSHRTNLTIQATIVRALQALGYVLVPDASRRYIVLHKEGSSAAWMWVGKSGACRYAAVKRFDASTPVSDKTRRTLLADRQDNLNATAI